MTHNDELDLNDCSYICDTLPTNEILSINPGHAGFNIIQNTGNIDTKPGYLFNSSLSTSGFVANSQPRNNSSNNSFINNLANKECITINSETSHPLLADLPPKRPLDQQKHHAGNSTTNRVSAPNPYSEFIYDEDTVHIQGNYLCKLCQLVFSLQLNLITHFNECHGKSLEVMKTTKTSIKSLDEFLDALLKTCNQTIILNNTVNKGYTTFKYFKCKYTWNGFKTCPYFVTVQIKSRNNIHIKYHLQHSHKPDFNQISIPPFVKNRLIIKLRQGISIERIWRDLTKEVAHNPITSREETITKDYLNYLKMKYTQTERIANDDETNFGYLLDKYVELGKIRIYSYYPFNKPGPHDNNNEEFVASFNTSFMQENFKKFHSKGIFFDSTHSTNRYGLLLVVGFVINSLHVSVPFIFILTTSENEYTLTTCGQDFLTTLEFQPRIRFFMSDMYPGFFNAWANASQTDIRYLYCYYHLRRAWNIKLNNLISNKPEKKKVANMINTLMNMTKEQDFFIIYQRLLSFTRVNCNSFYLYFMKQYSHHIERWALYIRTNAIANTNNACESFFSMFKRTQLNNNVRSRLDDLFLKLEDCSVKMSIQNKITLQSTYKTILGDRYRKTRKNHKKIYKLDGSKIFQISTSLYTFKKYEIKVCCFTCTECPKYECEVCQLCHHMMSCTCLNYLNSQLLCKHTHKVYDVFFKSAIINIKTANLRRNPAFTNARETNCENNYSNVQIVSSDIINTGQGDIGSSNKEIKQKIVKKLDILETYTTVNNDIRALGTVDECLEVLFKDLEISTLNRQLKDIEIDNSKRKGTPQNSLPLNSIYKKAKKLTLKKDKKINVGRPLNKPLVDLYYCKYCFMNEDDGTAMGIGGFSVIVANSHHI